MKNFTLAILLMITGLEVTAQSPVVFAGKNQDIYTGMPVQMKGKAYKVKNVIWTTEGNGYFDNPTALHTLYHPGPADISAGKVRLTLSSANNPGIKDKMGVTILPHVCPSLLLPALDDICADENGGEYPLNQAIVLGDSYSAQWTIVSQNTDPRSYISNDTSVSQAVFSYSASDGQAGATIAFQLTLTDLTGLCSTVSSIISVRFRDRPRIQAFYVNGVDENNGPSISCGLFPTSLEAYFLGPVDTIYFGGGSGRIENTGPSSALYYPTSGDIGSYISFSVSTNDPEGPCTGTGASNAVVYDFGIPNAGPDRTVCLSNTDSFITVSASIIGSPNNSFFYWSSNGSGDFYDYSSQSTPYYFSKQDITNGSVTFYAIFESCTIYTDTVTISLIQQPSVNFGGVLQICGYQGGLINLEASLSGSVNYFYWSTSGNGDFADYQNPATEYYYSTDDVNFANIIITATAESSNETCQFGPATGQLNVNLQEPAQVYIQDEYLDLCSSTTSIGLSADVYGYYSNGQWSSSGTGSFDNPNLPYTNYEVSEADISAGCIWLSYNVDGAGQCGGAGDNITICFQDCGRTSISTNEKEASEEPIIFPNPATSKLQINSKKSIQKSACYLSDLSGKSYQCKWNIDQSLDISTLAKGVYVVHLVSDTNTWHLKFIKQ